MNTNTSSLCINIYTLCSPPLAPPDDGSLVSTDGDLAAILIVGRHVHGLKGVGVDREIFHRQASWIKRRSLSENLKVKKMAQSCSVQIQRLYRQRMMDV